MPDEKSLGKIGENYARKLLEKRGYRILTRNFKTKLGEIDAIALDDDELVFIEVKTRASKKFGLPQESVGKKKLEKIKKVSSMFIKKSGINNKKMRIEVVSLIIKDKRVNNARIVKVG